MKMVDLFAGAGGWDFAAEELNLWAVGIENDKAACATRDAAGLRTIADDVRNTLPMEGYEVLVASPPCPGFSRGGRRLGRRDAPAIIAMLDECRDVEQLEEWVRDHEVEMQDERSILVLEPLRWALHTRPQWIALEQVPEVLPIWQAIGRMLQRHGYSVETDVLHAEQFAVPQSRRRAILVARSAGITEVQGPARLPEPGCSRFYPRDPDRRDEGLYPWVSMADVLGWGDGLVGFPRKADHQASVDIGGEQYRARDLRNVANPAFPLTEHARSWLHFSSAGGGAADRVRVTPRGLDKPASTITATGSATWVGPDGKSPTGELLEALASRAPGTLIKTRVTVAEASVLQTFPAEWPWQGSVKQQFRQIGNAIPPMLAWAILHHLVYRSTL